MFRCSSCCSCIHSSVYFLRFYWTNKNIALKSSNICSPYISLLSLCLLKWINEVRGGTEQERGMTLEGKHIRNAYLFYAFNYVSSKEYHRPEFPSFLPSFVRVCCNSESRMYISKVKPVRTRSRPPLEEILGRSFTAWLFNSVSPVCYGYWCSCWCCCCPCWFCC